MPEVVKWIGVLLMTLFVLFTACEQKTENGMIVTKEPFGKMPDGTVIHKFTLSNGNGMEVAVINYGAIVQSIKTRDRNDNMEDVVLGFDDLQSYIEDDSYFGGLVGRYGNRIAEGTFTLEGQKYTLAANNGPNHLHGGNKGFNKVVWEAEAASTEEAAAVKMHYLSKDGEEGYPGNLNTTVTYSLNEANEFEIEYEATTDKPTVVNLTHHGYFNLSGNCERSILEHELYINAHRFTPVDETLIPTGELRPVEGTPFDFTEPTPIGARINEDNQQLQYGKGYDHNWVLNEVDGTFKLQTSLYDPKSGRLLEIYTVEPGMQFYSGNFLDGSITGKNGKTYQYRYGLCLEPQHFPDSPNQPDFPSTVLRPGEKYQTASVYKFSVRK